MNSLRLLFLLPFILTAQTSAVKHITINEGLSQNYIYSILQDTKGFMWFGTKDGLNRYDGYSFKIYRKDNADSTSLTDNTVTAIHQGEDDRLWIGTASGGILLFDQRKEKFVRIMTSAARVRNYQVNVITTARNGKQYIGTSGGGLLVYSPQDHHWTVLFTDSNSTLGARKASIADVVEDRNGTMWVAADGLFMIGKDGIPIRVNHYADGSNQNTVNRISNLFCDSLGRVWVCHRTGIDLYSDGTFRRIISSTEQNNFYWFGKMRYDSYGKLWTTTIHHLLRFDPNTLAYEAVAAFPEERISGGFWVDRTNNVWIGTSGLGVMVYNPRIDKFGRQKGNFLKEIFPREFTVLESAIKKSENISTFDATLRGNEFRIPLKTDEGESFIPTSDAFIFRIDRQDKVKQYLLVPESTPDRKAFSPSFILQDSSRTVWIIRNGGLIPFSDQHHLFSYYPLYPDTLAPINTSGYTDISAAFISRDGMMWFGTPSNGLLQFNPQTLEKRWYQYRDFDSTSISHNHVLSIAEDPNEPDRLLWIGTDGGGLNVLDRTAETFSTIDERDGFPNNTVYGILPDENRNFWISTNKGLVKFNPLSRTMNVFDVYDGLQSNEFNRKEFFKNADGKLYFGGVNGYNAFYPSDITLNSSLPTVVFTDFRLFNKSVHFKSDSGILRQPIDFTDSIELEYTDNVFSFEFAAIEYSAPSKNQFKYMLKEFHEDWIHNGTSRTATFTNIDPGEYLFSVKAANGDGVWNDQASSIVIFIRPPFWRTPWFLSLMIIAGLSIGPVFQYRRLKKLKKEQRRQQEVSRLLIESQEGERKRIAQEMHDSLGQELLVIKNRALMGLKTIPEEAKEKHQLEQISIGATNVLKLLRTISHNLRPPELDRLGLTETIRSMLTNFQESSGTTMSMSIDEIDGFVNKEHEINIIRILQESLSNIQHHSDATDITVTLKQNNRMLTLSLQDNGKGFAPNEGKPGIGLAGITERVRLLEGALTVESKEGSGTEITVTIPIVVKAGNV